MSKGREFTTSLGLEGGGERKGKGTSWESEPFTRWLRLRSFIFGKNVTADEKGEERKIRGKTSKPSRNELVGRGGGRGKKGGIHPKRGRRERLWKGIEKCWGESLSNRNSPYLASTSL